MNRKARVTCPRGLYHHGTYCLRRDHPTPSRYHRGYHYGNKHKLKRFGWQQALYCLSIIITIFRPACVRIRLRIKRTRTSSALSAAVSQLPHRGSPPRFLVLLRSLEFSKALENVLQHLVQHRSRRSPKDRRRRHTCRGRRCQKWRSCRCPPSPPAQISSYSICRWQTRIPWGRCRGNPGGQGEEASEGEVQQLVASWAVEVLCAHACESGRTVSETGDLKRTLY